jgi:hypothetical protein
MALDTYANVQTAIITHAFRTGDTDFAAAVPDFITMTESRINRVLRVREMEESATISVSVGYGWLPDDYLEFRRVVANTSPTTPLELVTPDFAAGEYRTTYSGYPSHFTIIGDRIRVFPSTDATLAMNYYAKIPALSATNTTNWLLTKAPELYLYGGLVEAGPFMMDDAAAARYAALFQKAMSDLMSADTGARYARATMRVSGPTP